MLKTMDRMTCCQADAVMDLLQSRGRGYASEKEAWAELLQLLDSAKQSVKKLDKLHQEIWKGICDGNRDAVSVVEQDMARSAVWLATYGILLSAICEIQVEDIQLPPDTEEDCGEPQEDGKIVDLRRKQS